MDFGNRDSPKSSQKQEKNRNPKKRLKRVQEELSHLREGDSFVVMKLDRLGRTVKQLVDFIHHFEERGIHFVSLEDKIDTGSANGKFFFHIMSSFSELERELIRERTHIGLSSARARGRYGGRPETHQQDKKEIAYQMVMDKPHQTVAEIAKALHMSRSTIYRYIEKRRQIHLVS